MHKIKWTEITWNPVWGCRGTCEYCYAKIFAKRFAVKTAEIEWKYFNSSPSQRDVLLKKLKSFEPAFLLSQYNKDFPKKPKIIFMGSMTDIAFWEDKWIESVLRKINDYPQHIFQILTKYPEKIQHIDFPDNVWLGITAENQKNLHTRTKSLINIKSGKKFVSLEPLQEMICLDQHIKFPISDNEKIIEPIIKFIDWVIVGGQTGHKAVPMQPYWVRYIRDDCKKYGVPFFFKSWGTWLPWETDAQPPFANSQNGQTIDTHALNIFDPETSELNKNWYDTLELSNNMLGFEKTGSKVSGNMLDGKIYQEFPK